MASVKALMGEMQKQMGKAVGSYGGVKPEAVRIPTGLFQLDLALGGGFPRGKVSTIFGKESSGKTNISLCLIREHQRMYPDETCAFVDLEHSFDPVWAAKLGVDVEKLAVFKPDYAEQAVDIIDALLLAEDTGLVIVDSLAAFVTFNESESSSEKAIVGGSALLVGKLFRKATLNQNKMAKVGRFPTVVCINQTRQKVGVVRGNDETEPGGAAPLFFSSIRLRVYGRNVMDSKVSKTKPVIKEIKCIVKKWKCPIVKTECVVNQVMMAHGHLKTGESDDWNTVSNMLKDYGLLAKNEGKGAVGYTMLGQQYKLLSDAKDHYQTNKEFAHLLRRGLIEKVLEDDAMLGAQEDDADTVLEESE